MNLFKLIYHYTPKFIKKRVVERHNSKVIELGKQRLKMIVSKQYLNDIFEKLELDSDVFMHTSLIEIGRIEGGYKEVVKQINKNILDKNHTALFSALPFKGSSEQFLKSIDTFDFRSAPVEMGTINEYYSMLPDAYRSKSPTHSVVAVGKNAAYYTNDHHLSETPFTKNSPYYRLIEKQAKILMIGAGVKHLTFNHIVDDLLGDDFPVRVYAKRRYRINILDKSGNSTIGQFKAHREILGVYKNPKCVVNDAIRSLPSTIIYSLGCSELILLDARDVVICLLNSLKKGDTIYGKRRISKVASNKIDTLIRQFEK